MIQRDSRLIEEVGQKEKKFYQKVAFSAPGNSLSTMKKFANLSLLGEFSFVQYCCSGGWHSVMGELKIGFGFSKQMRTLMAGQEVKSKTPS